MNGTCHEAHSLLGLHCRPDAFRVSTAFADDTEGCDMLCRLRGYLATDHMAPAPADAASPRAGAKHTRSAATNHKPKPGVVTAPGASPPKVAVAKPAPAAKTAGGPTKAPQDRFGRGRKACAVPDTRTPSFHGQSRAPSRQVRGGGQNGSPHGSRGRCCSADRCEGAIETGRSPCRGARGPACVVPAACTDRDGRRNDCEPNRTDPRQRSSGGSRVQVAGAARFRAAAAPSGVAPSGRDG